MQGEAICSELIGEGLRGGGGAKYVGFSSQLELGPLAEWAAFHSELMAGEKRERSRVFHIAGNTQGQATLEPVGRRDSITKNK